MEIDKEVSFHDFRMVEGQHQINLIFDMVVPHDYTREQEKEVKRKLRAALKEMDARYCCVIMVERSFVAK